MWVTAFIPGGPACRYGQRTSNPVEAMNSVLKKARELSVIDLLTEMWHYTMETRFAHLESANKVPTGQIFTPYCVKILGQERQNAQQFLVQLGDHSHGFVQLPQSNSQQYTVDLAIRTCTCHNFQKHNLPCQHVIACIYALSHQLDMYIPSEFLAVTWTRTYASNMRPVAFNENDNI